MKKILLIGLVTVGLVSVSFARINNNTHWILNFHQTAHEIQNTLLLVPVEQGGNFYMASGIIYSNSVVTPRDTVKIRNEWGNKGTAKYDLMLGDKSATIGRITIHQQDYGQMSQADKSHYNICTRLQDKRVDSDVCIKFEKFTNGVRVYSKNDKYPIPFGVNLHLDYMYTQKDKGPGRYGEVIAEIDTGFYQV